MNGQFQKYSDVINDCMIYVGQVLKPINKISQSNISTVKHNLKSKTDIMKNHFTTIINDFDPHSNCEYYVSLGIPEDLTETNVNPISPIGIGYTTYLSCDEDIDLSIKNKYYADHILNNMTESELLLLTDRVKRNNDSDFIRIYQNNSGICQCINFNFITRNLVFVDKTNIIVSDLPTDSRVATSILRVKQQEQDEIIPIPLYSNKMFDTYFENILDTLSDDEYHALCRSIYDQSYLSKNNTNSFNNHTDIINTIDINDPRFCVEYIFNELVIKSGNTDLVNDQMIKSFIDLATKTSILKRI